MYNKQEKVIMWLSSFDFMSYKKAKAMIDNFQDICDVFDNLMKYKEKLLKIFTIDEFNELRQENNLNYIERVIDNYEKLGIKVVTLKSEEYPELLSEIDSSPIMLYCKGDVSLLKSDCLAVVGTRRATAYGKNAGSKIVKDCASSGLTIVSGLADGIDTMAHKSTLEVQGKTIAVLGGGILNIYPSSNITLAEDIVSSGGLIISEYKPNEPIRTFQFPIRNRIIAGLSKATVIIEATEKSGSMHTKNYAIEYNREVFALPARITDIYSTGCNKLIRNGQARILLEVSDILEVYDKSSVKRDVQKAIQLTCEEQIIYDILSGSELHFDEIAKKSSMKTNILQTNLMRMEINGILRKLPGNYYELVR